MPATPGRDVRMRGFHERAAVESVLRLIDQRVRPLGSESVSLADAAGRILSEDVIAPCNVPGFDRAAMDGYALRGGETSGADDSSPVEFAVVGESFPARPFAGRVDPGQAVRIMTGAPLPAGADAIAQVEIVTESDRRIQVRGPVALGRHVGRVGEDIE